VRKVPVFIDMHSATITNPFAGLGVCNMETHAGLDSHRSVEVAHLSEVNSCSRAEAPVSSGLDTINNAVIRSRSSITPITTPIATSTRAIDYGIVSAHEGEQRSVQMPLVVVAVAMVSSDLVSTGTASIMIDPVQHSSNVVVAVLVEADVVDFTGKSSIVPLVAAASIDLFTPVGHPETESAQVLIASASSYSSNTIMIVVICSEVKGTVRVRTVELLVVNA